MIYCICGIEGRTSKCSLCWAEEVKQLRLRLNQVEGWLRDKSMEIAEIKELLEYSAAYIKHPFTDRINSANLLEKIEKALQPLILCGPCGVVIQHGDPGHEKSGYSYCEKCAPTEKEEGEEK